MAAKRRVRDWTVRVVGVLALLAGVWILVFQPLGQAPAATLPITAPIVPEPIPATGSNEASSSAAPRPLQQATRPAAPGTSPRTQASTCRAGSPARLIIPALHVDAPFERIGLDPNARPDATGKRPLGNPVDRRHAGWYDSGPQPGTGRGTVIINGHTYRNGSAIFKEDFAARVTNGQRIDLVQANGATCSYRIDRIWRTVDSKRDYPVIVSREGLYDFSGPERLLLVTCGGRWSDQIQNYLDINIVVATPINR